MTPETSTKNRERQPAFSAAELLDDLNDALLDLPEIGFHDELRDQLIRLGDVLDLLDSRRSSNYTVTQPEPLP
jgi:hypothetical protein